MTKSKTLYEVQLNLQLVVQKKAKNTELINIVLENPPISTDQRLQIYQNAYQIRLIESLRDDFPKLEAHIGSENFDILAIDYILKNPSTVQNLAEYSFGFPLFIETKDLSLSMLAYRDWYEVLSRHAKAPTDQITVDEISNGQIFKIKIHPSTFIKNIHGSCILVYKNQDTDEIENEELDNLFFSLLDFLQTEKNLEEIMIFLQNKSISDETIVKTIHEWIKKQIIYCQK